MDDTPYLRRQAALCLNLSTSCSDAQVAEHLDLMAAEFHARALKAEFQTIPDAEFSADEIDERDIEDLRLLLTGSEIAEMLTGSEIAEMFDETARQRIGEFISRAASQAKLGFPLKR